MTAASSLLPPTRCAHPRPGCDISPPRDADRRGNGYRCQARTPAPRRLLPLPQDRVIRAAPVSALADGSGAGAFEEEEEYEKADSEKLAVTVVTGFLGSGKTTLVNYILREQHGKRICVIENEFGAALVKENLSSAEEVISMDNGCACCTVRGDLVRALTQLKDRKDSFDLVLLETTGLADPAPILATFTQNWTISNNYRIDGVLCLTFPRPFLDLSCQVRPEGTVNEAVQQVAFADRVLLNKLDLVDKGELGAVKTLIQEVNAFAELIECQQSRVPVDKLMDMNAFSMERFQEEIAEYDLEEDAAAEECTDEQEGAREGQKAKKRKHDISGVGSFALQSEHALDSQLFNRFMVQLLQRKKEDLYRSKGVLCFEGEGDAKYIFQGVHEQIQFEQSNTKWVEGEPRVSKVVFIGRDLDREEIEAAFRTCIVHAQTAHPH
ncbi:hypothetical protein EMIHUDRAFT_74134 [Emiliania huxleyi CCMP1516]|uniref:CobW C-terminal domain-containing protein n=2 Tax=Emiliania huxleyi TaxID=2903 RepID=A0A0D3JLR0_EMIH1|nr:hypothetical protein EMIHUDRAFT_74134 [Emiliania huxleyi CCMP1516]EOD24445.1 hypothetical protein EMIHUDRAFT_74134 [Emiliania huxleyi CCMP1516]|eukprot:XP_005776874.1 hypothetical protein EMIHUDRAFT_74134 [Emiliania huxleyi CCMP1516]